MDVNAVVTLISSVGFPIVACLGVAWYCKYQLDKYDAQIKEISSEHKEELKEVTSALNNNTLAIEKLCERLGN